MAKNIVFCADGTWNGPGQGGESEEISGATNVLKTFLNLAGSRSVLTVRLSDEEESNYFDAGGKLLQIAKYIHGVGDSENFLVKILGGAFGAGLVTRIVRGYTFICRNYQDGDRIYIIGFSRGAYTARALGGLIARQGLIDASKIDLATDKTVAYRWGSAVWYQNRQESSKGDDNKLGALAEMILDWPSFFLKPPPKSQMISANIKAIGVWDTVGSLGIPEYNATTGERIASLRFVDTQLATAVENGFHAISMDERRADFTPTLWDKRDGVTQRLFPGAHSDVGGGFPEGDESGLSDSALNWMTDQLTQVGVLFGSPFVCAARPNPAGVAHAPWLHFPWNALPRSPRVFSDYLATHCQDASIDAREHAGPVRADPTLNASIYSPGNT
jgi:uncharacterized protein (DUF2235 family)